MKKPGRPLRPRRAFLFMREMEGGGTHEYFLLLTGLFGVLGNLVDVEGQHVILVSVGDFLGQPV